MRECMDVRRVWHGIVCMVWHGIAWHDMAWYCMVCMVCNGMQFNVMSCHVCMHDIYIYIRYMYYVDI